MSITSELAKSSHEYFKKCYIKRRPNTITGEYENSWYDVTDLVKQWGTSAWTIDDVELNKFEQSSVNMVFKNNDRQWADKSNPKSLFHGYLSRYKTKVKIHCGIYDDDHIEQPTNNAIFYGVITDDIELGSDDEAFITVNSLQWVLQEQNAGAITSLTSVTASNIVENVRDLIDTNSISVFGNFISNGAWDIQTTTVVYADISTQGLSNYSCWDLVNKLAESENFIVYLDNQGAFHFKDRTANTTVAVYGFNGAGVKNDPYGINIISFDKETSGWNKLYQRINCKFQSAETATSYYAAEETWTVGDSSSSWAYGQRTYSFENTWLNSAGAQTLTDAIQIAYVNPKREFEFTTKLITHLNISDPVYVNWLGEILAGTPSYWGRALWGVDVWTGRTGGIYVDSVTCNIIRCEMNLDEDTSRFKVRQQ